LGEDDTRRRNPMRYLLLIYTAEATEPPPPELMAASEGLRGLHRGRPEAGLMQAGEALEPTTTATTVRVRDGETVTTDGPFAERRSAGRVLPRRRA